jgi:lysophospholipase L1-like esterase
MIQIKRFIGSAMLTLAALLPTLVHAQPVEIVFTGDSFTRRTGQCTVPGEDYIACDKAGRMQHETNYPTYVWIFSRFQFLPVYNSGRGGDTCTTQAAWPSNGIYYGENRGLVTRVSSTVLSRGGSTVSVLIGANDVNGFGVSIADTISCIMNVWSQLHAGGRKVVAVTYPPVSSINTVWAIPASTAASNIVALNAAIRNAITTYNAQSTNKVQLADLANAWGGGSPDMYTSDGVHPTGAGGYLAGRAWFQSLCNGGNTVIGCSY